MTLSNLQILLTDWQTHHQELTRVRHTVFVEEQQVPVALELDHEDAGATHFLCLLPNGTPVATARLLNDGHIGRMAVLREYRGQQVGNRLLAFVIAEAQRRNLSRVLLHAQTQAIGFYEQAGFIAEGEIFLDAGIEHQQMTLQLPADHTQPVHLAAD